MPTIAIEESGLIYANPRPHLRSRQAAFPTIVRLPSGALLAAFTVGEAFESVDCRTELARSADGGQTWEQLGPLPQGATDHPVSESGRLSLAADGTVLCFGPRFDRSDPERSIGNAATNGLVDCEAVLYRSTDEGRSWSAPEALPIPLPGPYEIASPIVVLPDGRWLALFSTWRNWEGVKLAGDERSLALVSHDGGRTWGELMGTFADPEGQITYWEQRVIPIGAGRLMATSWAHDHRRGVDLPNQFAISEDGRSFGPPRSTGQLGQTCAPTWLGGDRLLSIYNQRHGDMGVHAALVRFSPDGWRAEADALLWGQGGSGAPGAASIVGAMNQFRFGFPAALALSDDRFLVSHWCMEHAQLVARWTRIRVGW